MLLKIDPRPPGLLLLSTVGLPRPSPKRHPARLLSPAASRREPELERRTPAPPSLGERSQGRSGALERENPQTAATPHQNAVSQAAFFILTSLSFFVRIKRSKISSTTRATLKISQSLKLSSNRDTSFYTLGARMNIKRADDVNKLIHSNTSRWNLRSLRNRLM